MPTERKNHINYSARAARRHLSPDAEGAGSGRGEDDAEDESDSPGVVELMRGALHACLS